ncbi:hypothetical protein [Planktotalea sp.]|uniref:hypothetical protein n=1 Tax=Planktotalea sp. TaxID=2029877 RepID=UPI0025D595A1|nr:hypothetical protein [Planktotalea sp.]
MSTDDDLTALFDEVRRTPPEPSTDFMQRVLNDGQTMQPAPLGVMRMPPRKRGQIATFFAGLSDALGGWPAFAGLATAAVTGLWIGISPPQTLLTPFGMILGDDSAALSGALEYGDGFDFTLFEG